MTWTGTDRNSPVALVLFAVGTVCIVAGGLVSAVTGPLELRHGSWLAAYLVLTAGVGQCLMGAARMVMGDDTSHAARGWMQVLSWNLGNALVILGTLAALPFVVDAGGLGCMVALAIALLHSRRLPNVALAWGYRLVLAVMLVSIPVGLVLAQLRHGT